MRDYVDNSGLYLVESFVPYLSVRLHFHPELVAEQVLDRMKFAAKHLSKTACIGHSRALEVIAISFDFKNYFDFLNHLSEVTLPGAASEAWRTKMDKAFLLLGCDQADVRLPKEHLRGWTSIANSISTITDTPVAVLLDQMCSRLFSAGSWVEVVNRSPLKASQPLFWFSEKWGHFERSPACSQLRDDLDDLLHGGDAPPARDQAIHRWLETTLKYQPTFVDAASQLSWRYWKAGDVHKALEIAEFPVAYMNSLIPDEYTGTVADDCGENRAFLHLHYMKMVIKESLGDYFDALDFAERILFFNPRDGLGVRQDVPRLLKRLGRPDIAKEWTKKLRKDFFYYPVMRDSLLTELVSEPLG
ncbi:hypothetical protein [Pseudomonas baetica]|uniref:hypothetical protein n=1 Tax=Pseudomonas baetica TaxID=674054 RepID=UPI002405EBA3|nr:hypothetical protein [Pseudomonas baetica]MDF9778778.1 tetratricopeptide (TPR) repeat protein [Pseudomonas baetica]